MKKSLLLIIPSILINFLVLQGQANSSSTQQSEKRIALVIGNGNYDLSMPLANPENDARSMAEVLQKVGFIVFKYENLKQSEMKKTISEFGAKLKGNDVGLFYYAGHGIQAKGFNYLIPVDAQLKSEEEVDFYCVRADMILASMETSGTKVNIIILDACRNNPFERSWTRSATGRGLAFMSAPSGTLIAYATAPGSVASDGNGKNGLYTSAILESIQIPNITIEELFKNVRNIVAQKSQKQQMPWESTSLTGNFYFFADSPRNLPVNEPIQKVIVSPPIESTNIEAENDESSHIKSIRAAYVKLNLGNKPVISLNNKIINGKKSGFLYYGTERLMFSADNGLNWQALSPVIDKQSGVVTNNNYKSPSAISSIIIDPLNEARIVVGTYNGIISLTSDNGKTWANLYTNNSDNSSGDTLEVLMFDRRKEGFIIAGLHHLNNELDGEILIYLKNGLIAVESKMETGRIIEMIQSIENPDILVVNTSDARLEFDLKKNKLGRLISKTVKK